MQYSWHSVVIVAGEVSSEQNESVRVTVSCVLLMCIPVTPSKYQVYNWKWWLQIIMSFGNLFQWSTVLWLKMFFYIQSPTCIFILLIPKKPCRLH